ncbi:MAG: alpha-amylase family protein [bacterium]
MIPFGVTYYPDQWPKETWDKTFAEIKKAGFNIVRFGEMAWDWMEPKPGKFNFKELDYAMALCKKHGLKVLLGIPTSQVPLWFHRKFPGSQPIAQDGTKYPEFGPRPNICKDNKNYRKLAERLAKKLVSRYKNHPALLMWQLDNEPVYPPLDHTTSNDYCHCPDSRRAFFNWAKKKYGSIKELNKVWGMRFWTNSLSSFEDIQTPKGGIWDAGNPHVFLDWFRFKTDSLKAWIENLAQIVRKIDKEHKVGTNGFVGIVTRTPDHSLMTEKMDWYGLDIYPLGGRMDQRSYEFMLDLWRSFTRGTKAEFHVTELQGGQNVRWGNPGYVKGPEIKGWTETAFKHGVKSLLYHNWRPPLFGAETGGFGILQQDGSSTKRLETIKKLAKNIRHSSFVIRHSDIAIAYLHNSEIQTFQEQGPPRGIAGQWEPVRTDIGLMHALDSISGAHLVAYKKDQPVDFIFERDLDSGKLPYKTILLPNPYLLSKKQYNNLKKWVQAGGTLITEARFGLKDENGHLYEKPLMEDLLGVKYEYTVPTKKGFFDGLKGKPKKEKLITKKIGKGKVVCANFSLFLQIRNGNKRLQKMIRKLAA